MKQWFTHIFARQWLVKHAGGLLPSSQQRQLFRHMEVCGECHALYTAQLWTEQRGPEAVQERRARLERSLFGQADPDPALQTIRRRTWALTGAASTCVALLFILARFWSGGAFQDKGNSQDELSRYVSITAYRRTVSGEFAPVGGTIEGTDQLAFAYSNMSDRGLDHLLLFGADESGTIYWYYPAWTDSSQNPAAFPIGRGVGVELPEQVGHQYRGGRLRIFALFCDRADLTVRHIEGTVQTLRQRGVKTVDLEQFPQPGCGQQSFVLKMGQP